MTDGVSSTVSQAHGAASGLPAIGPRLASRALYASVVAMIASMIAISLFFGGVGAFWGPVNDLLVVATVLLLLPAMLAVRQLSHRRVGTWLTWLTWLAIGGVVVIATGQLALVVGLITLDTSFLTGGLGVLPVIAWVGATAVLVHRADVLGRAVGWWAIGFLAGVAVTVMVIPALGLDTPTATTVLGLPLMLALFGWMVSLARDLARADVAS